VLVELSVMEQRYQAVLAVVQDGWQVVEVARRLGVSRQTVHAWIARYEAGGLAALADRSHLPRSCPHQTAAEIEAAICELRREHPGWGPRRIEHQLGRLGIDPVPSRSAIYRCLRRHGLVELRRRRKRRDEFRRWERERPMQLWQMDVMGGIFLAGGAELKVLTGIDDHSRFCVGAGLVRRRPARSSGSIGRSVRNSSPAGCSRTSTPPRRSSTPGSRARTPSVRTRPLMWPHRRAASRPRSSRDPRMPPPCSGPRRRRLDLTDRRCRRG
jgi:transposase